MKKETRVKSKKKQGKLSLKPLKYKEAVASLLSVKRLKEKEGN